MNNVRIVLDSEKDEYATNRERPLLFTRANTLGK